jgi:NADPH:quinone reductase
MFASRRVSCGLLVKPRSSQLRFLSSLIPSDGLISSTLCESFDKPLALIKLPYVPPPEDSVCIKVAAAGINFADILQCKGLYQEKLMPPFTPGWECVGQIAETGPGVDSNKYKVGDWVICMGDKGAFASHVTSKLSSVLWSSRETKTGFDYQHGAALLVTYGTAYLALKYNAALKGGETVLITAASGGVGLAAVELASKVWGCRVIAAVSTPEKLEVARCAGATAGICYAGMDGKAFRGEVQRAAAEVGGAGVDVMVDMVGGELLEAGTRALNWEGRAVVVGFADGRIPKIPANILLLKNVSMSGLYWGAHRQQSPLRFQESIDEVVRLWLDGVLAPHVSHRVPLSEVNRAFELIAGRSTTGKVLLIPDDA